VRFGKVVVFIFDSESGEPFGIAPLEAMASGLPLIAPDRGGVLSYANSSNAWIVPPIPEAFAQAIRRSDIRRYFAGCRIENALLTAQQFRWENVANSFLDLYEDMFLSKSGELPRFHPDFVSTASRWTINGCAPHGELFSASVSHSLAQVVVCSRLRANRESHKAG
jgi:Glycosyl transferases group 1